jgi:uncharacterized protein YkwD
VTRSPWPEPPAIADDDARERELANACGAPDAALDAVARRIALRRARGLGAPEPDAVVSMLRAVGEPHVRPRVVTASGRAPLTLASVRDRLSALRTEKRTRCGVAIESSPHGGELLVAVAVEALADLQPLPTRARPGEWLALEAKLNVPAYGVRVVLTGPRGAPRTVPTTLDRETGALRARFALDRPGAFTVQVLAELDRGPQPVLEARVFAGTEPPDDDAEPSAAPGEEAASGGDDATSLFRMTTALRSAEGISPIVRDERLDALARTHAERMRDEGTVAHDLGEGDLKARFDASHLGAKAIGENVARAQSVELAHRALHASPSHRMNLLRAEYTHVGVAVVRGDDGHVYACQVFAAGLR